MAFSLNFSLVEPRSLRISLATKNTKISKLPQPYAFAHNKTKHYSRLFSTTTTTARILKPATTGFTTSPPKSMEPSLQLLVQRKPPVLVAPAEPTPHEFKPLSDIDDQESLRFHVPFVQYYKNNPTMEGQDPVKVIKEALAKALVFYYPFAGRLREEPGRKLTVDCTGEGVLFIEADANVKLEEFGDRLPPPLPWLKELLCDVPGYDGIVGCPLLLIQVTRLACGGFIFAVRLNHTMADAQGIAQFLNAIGEIACGAPDPTVPPVWARELLSARNPPSITQTHREFDTIPESQRTRFPPDEQLVRKSFFFGPKELAVLKRNVPFSCTSFEVLAASAWRARTIALRLDPNDELRFMFNINLRSRTSPPMPQGYYGNVFVYPAVLSNARQLCDSPLSYAVDLVKKAKAKATDEYIKSVTDLMVLKGRPPFAMNGAPRVYFVSDNTRVGYAEVDYGWGPAVYGGPAAWDFDDVLHGLLSFFVAFRNEKGELGTVVPMCLPKDAMERFSAEIEQLIQPQAVVEADRDTYL